MPSNFIERVLRAKQEEITRKVATVPLEALETRIADRNVMSPRRDFYRAISGHERIIAEIKRRSPVVAAFRQAPAVLELGPVYERHGAAAISVVTDEAHFGMSLEDAQQIRRQVAVPILIKDFIVNRYQITEARAHEADALLLIARIVDGRTLASLLDVTHELGMWALVEIHDAEDLSKAVAAGARIIGINNRNLETLQVGDSVDTTRQLIEAIPDDVIVVAESGISKRSEIEGLTALGVGAFLVGGALLQSEDPGALLDMLQGARRANTTW